jgi:Zn-dependent peptidase ImmA (M78 family)/transcriptional regulator with XRE-family HTH domain
MATESFGKFAQRLRLKKKLGLRQAARQMGVSPAYLSQVERNKDLPSRRLLASMWQLYEQPPETLLGAAERAGAQHRERRTPAAARSIEDLRALYRLGAMFTTDEVEGMVRHMLQQHGMTEDQIQRELCKFRAELPRMRGGDGLFASDIKPRFLSKRRVTQIAERILSTNGLDRSRYKPPTPIETLVENEEGVSYVIDHLPSTDGDPIVLGRSRWVGDVREITINADLAASDRECDGHRFRFTLGHEFFHALEHLPLAAASVGHLPRTALEIGFVDRAAPRARSTAERAVRRWATTGRSRSLASREDWREWQANVFASAILMPEWSIKDSFHDRLGADCALVPQGENCRDIALELAGEVLFSGKIYAQSLAQLFEVSRQAMAIRLLDLGLVREVDADNE